MKASIIIPLIGSITLFCFFSACDQTKERPIAPVKKRLELDSTSLYQDENYKIYTLEGCEYVVYGYGDSRWGTHKGNCKNPLHKQ